MKLQEQVAQLETEKIKLQEQLRLADQTNKLTSAASSTLPQVLKRKSSIECWVWGIEKQIGDGRWELGFCGSRAG